MTTSNCMFLSELGFSRQLLLISLWLDAIVSLFPRAPPLHPGMPLEYTEKSDVYSLIISLWEILARQKPYADSASKCKLTIFWSVFRRRPTPLQKCPPLLSKLLERCVSSVCVRPTIKVAVFVIPLVLTRIRCWNKYKNRIIT